MQPPCTPPLHPHHPPPTPAGPPLQVLWDVQSGSAICGTPTSSNFTNTIKFFHNRNDKLVSAGG